MTTVLAVSDQSDVPIDSWADLALWLGGVVLVAFAILLFFGMFRSAGKPRPTPLRPMPPAVEEPVIPVRTAPEPALRVHLCDRCHKAPVDRPGEVCYPYCTSVVHQAEQIVREAERRHRDRP